MWWSNPLTGGAVELFHLFGYIFIATNSMFNWQSIDMGTDHLWRGALPRKLH